MDVIVGTPATINLFSDTSAAVVVKVNKKSIVVRRVETSEAVRDENRDGELPVMVAQGIVDRPFGEPERYSLIGVREDGTPRYANGSISITLGRSVKITDYRY